MADLKTPQAPDELPAEAGDLMTLGQWAIEARVSPAKLNHMVQHGEIKGGIKKSLAGWNDLHEAVNKARI